ncbi:CAP domain-containing protein [Catenulispora subtropica]
MPESRPASHRRPAVAREHHVPLRSSAVLALVSGLAITTPLLLRTHHHEIVLGPERTGPPSAADPAPDPVTASASTAVGAASTGDRTVTPISRNATRSPAGALSTPPSASDPAPIQNPQAWRSPGGPDGQLSPDQAAAFEDQVVALTNAQRTAHGCPALRSDHRLQLAAIDHSVDMQARNYFAHDAPDGVTPWTRIEAQGYADPSAENIAMGQGTPQAVLTAWMNSPEHRANILDCSSKAVGVGVQFGTGGPWWTEDFGYS